MRVGVWASFESGGMACLASKRLSGCKAQAKSEDCCQLRGGLSTILSRENQLRGLEEPKCRDLACRGIFGATPTIPTRPPGFSGKRSAAQASEVRLTAITGSLQNNGLITVGVPKKTMFPMPTLPSRLESPRTDLWHALLDVWHGGHGTVGSGRDLLDNNNQP